MSTLREYAVILRKFEDLDDFYDDMESPGGPLYIPNRRVEVSIRAPRSRITYYMLTQEEAIQLINDPRVESCELSLREAPIERRPANWYGGDYTFSGSATGPTLRPWSHLRTVLGSNIKGDTQRLKNVFAKPGTDSELFFDLNTVFYNTVWQDTIRSSISGDGLKGLNFGQHVDVVVSDGHIWPQDPEFAVNLNGTGASRFVNYDWFQHVGAITENLFTVGGPYQYYHTSLSADNHGQHVASSIAGNNLGLANRANIYNIYPYGHPFAAETFLHFDLIREFHLNKPINPITGAKNSTIVNCSWVGTFFFNTNIPRHSVINDDTLVTINTTINWRGTVQPFSFTYGQLKNMGFSPANFYYDNNSEFKYFQLLNWSNEESTKVLELTGTPGIIVIGAAGNFGHQIVNPNHPDYNNVIAPDDVLRRTFTNRGCAPASARAVPPSWPQDVIFKANIVYGPDNLQRVNSYQYTGPVPLGVVLHIHGGSWQSETLKENIPMFSNIAARGWSIIDINYRGVNNNRGSNGNGQYPNNVNDIKTVLNYCLTPGAGNAADPFWANISSYVQNRDRIVVLGGSAGGHLAVMGVCSYGTESGKWPTHVVSIAAPYDLNHIRTFIDPQLVDSVIKPYVTPANINNETILNAASPRYQYGTATSKGPWFDAVNNSGCKFHLMHNINDSLVVKETMVDSFVTSMKFFNFANVVVNLYQEGPPRTNWLGTKAATVKNGLNPVVSTALPTTGNNFGDLYNVTWPAGQESKNGFWLYDNGTYAGDARVPPSYRGFTKWFDHNFTTSEENFIQNALTGVFESYPEDRYAAICVGNWSWREDLAVSSNRGNRVDIYAPGTKILGAVNKGTLANYISGRDLYTGTSMASPHVAGMAAVIAEWKRLTFPATPLLTQPEFREILLKTLSQTVNAPNGGSVRVAWWADLAKSSLSSDDFTGDIIDDDTTTSTTTTTAPALSGFLGANLTVVNSAPVTPIVYNKVKMSVIDINVTENTNHIYIKQTWPSGTSPWINLTGYVSNIPANKVVKLWLWFPGTNKTTNNFHLSVGSSANKIITDLQTVERANPTVQSNSRTYLELMFYKDSSGILRCSLEQDTLGPSSSYATSVKNVQKNIATAAAAEVAAAALSSRNEFNPTIVTNTAVVGTPSTLRIINGPPASLNQGTPVYVFIRKKATTNNFFGQGYKANTWMSNSGVLGAKSYVSLAGDGTYTETITYGMAGVVTYEVLFPSSKLWSYNGSRTKSYTVTVTAVPQQLIKYSLLTNYHLVKAGEIVNVMLGTNDIINGTNSFHIKSGARAWSSLIDRNSMPFNNSSTFSITTSSIVNGIRSLKFHILPKVQEGPGGEDFSIEFRKNNTTRAVIGFKIISNVSSLPTPRNFEGLLQVDSLSKLYSEPLLLNFFSNLNTGSRTFRLRTSQTLVEDNTPVNPIINVGAIGEFQLYSATGLKAAKFNIAYQPGHMMWGLQSVTNAGLTSTFIYADVKESNGSWRQIASIGPILYSAGTQGYVDSTAVIVDSIQKQNAQPFYFNVASNSTQAITEAKLLLGSGQDNQSSVFTQREIVLLSAGFADPYLFARNSRALVKADSNTSSSNRSSIINFSGKAGSRDLPSNPLLLISTVGSNDTPVQPPPGGSITSTYAFNAIKRSYDKGEEVVFTLLSPDADGTVLNYSINTQFSSSGLTSSAFYTDQLRNIDNSLSGTLTVTGGKATLRKLFNIASSTTVFVAFDILKNGVKVAVPSLTQSKSSVIQYSPNRYFLSAVATTNSIGFGSGRIVICGDTLSTYGGVEVREGAAGTTAADYVATSRYGDIVTAMSAVYPNHQIINMSEVGCTTLDATLGTDIGSVKNPFKTNGYTDIFDMISKLKPKVVVIRYGVADAFRLLNVTGSDYEAVSSSSYTRILNIVKHALNNGVEPVVIGPHSIYNGLPNPTPVYNVNYTLVYSNAYFANARMFCVKLHEKCIDLYTLGVKYLGPIEGGVDPGPGDLPDGLHCGSLYGGKLVASLASGLSSRYNMTEGQTITVTVNTSGLPPLTQIPYAISDMVSADFVGNPPMQSFLRLGTGSPAQIPKIYSVLFEAGGWNFEYGKTVGTEAIDCYVKGNEIILSYEPFYRPGALVGNDLKEAVVAAKRLGYTVGVTISPYYADINNPTPQQAIDEIVTTYGIDFVALTPFYIESAQSSSPFQGMTTTSLYRWTFDKINRYNSNPLPGVSAKAIKVFVQGWAKTSAMSTVSTYISDLLYKLPSVSEYIYVKKIADDAIRLDNGISAYTGNIADVFYSPQTLTSTLVFSPIIDADITDTFRLSFSNPASSLSQLIGINSWNITAQTYASIVKDVLSATPTITKFAPIGPDFNEGNVIPFTFNLTGPIAKNYFWKVLPLGSTSAADFTGPTMGAITYNQPNVVQAFTFNVNLASDADTNPRESFMIGFYDDQAALLGTEFVKFGPYNIVDPNASVGAYTYALTNNIVTNKGNTAIVTLTTNDNRTNESWVLTYNNPATCYAFGTYDIGNMTASGHEYGYLGGDPLNNVSIRVQSNSPVDVILSLTSVGDIIVFEKIIDKSITANVTSVPTSISINQNFKTYNFTVNYSVDPTVFQITFSYYKIIYKISPFTNGRTGQQQIPVVANYTSGTAQLYLERERVVVASTNFTVPSVPVQQPIYQHSFFINNEVTRFDPGTFVSMTVSTTDTRIGSWVFLYEPSSDLVQYFEDYTLSVGMNGLEGIKYTDGTLIVTANIGSATESIFRTLTSTRGFTFKASNPVSSLGLNVINPVTVSAQGNRVEFYCDLYPSKFPQFEATTFDIIYVKPSFAPNAGSQGIVAMFKPGKTGAVTFIARNIRFGYEVKSPRITVDYAGTEPQVETWQFVADSTNLRVPGIQDTITANVHYTVARVITNAVAYKGFSYSLRYNPVLVDLGTYSMAEGINGTAWIEHSTQSRIVTRARIDSIADNILKTVVPGATISINKSGRASIYTSVSGAPTFVLVGLYVDWTIPVFNAPTPANTLIDYIFIQIPVVPIERGTLDGNLRTQKFIVVPRSTGIATANLVQNNTSLSSINFTILGATTTTTTLGQPTSTTTLPPTSTTTLPPTSTTTLPPPTSTTTTTLPPTTSTTTSGPVFDYQLAFSTIDKGNPASIVVSFTFTTNNPYLGSNYTISAYATRGGVNLPAVNINNALTTLQSLNRPLPSCTLLLTLNNYTPGQVLLYIDVLLSGQQVATTNINFTITGTTSTTTSTTTLPPTTTTSTSTTTLPPTTTTSTSTTTLPPTTTTTTTSAFTYSLTTADNTVTEGEIWTLLFVTNEGNDPSVTFGITSSHPSYAPVSNIIIAPNLNQTSGLYEQSIDIQTGYLAALPPQTPVLNVTIGISRTQNSETTNVVFLDLFLQRAG